MTTATMPEYVTKSEFDARINFHTQMTDVKIEALRELIDSRTAVMQATIERGEARHQAIASEIRSEMKDLRLEMTELRGDMKALDAGMNALETKFGWYLAIFGVGITIAFGVLQLFMK